MSFKSFAINTLNTSEIERMSELLNRALKTANDAEALAKQIKRDEAAIITGGSQSAHMSTLTTIYLFGKQHKEHIDFLSNNSGFAIKVLDTDKALVHTFNAPQHGWNVDNVRSLEIPTSIRDNVYDVFLNEVWIGSSEI